MKEEEFDLRTKTLLKEDYIKLQNANICICGIGGVGSFVFEALVRIGVLNITIIDFDKIDITNINRQLIALNTNIGKFKVDEAVVRAKNINKNIKITSYKTKLNEENIKELIGNKFDYVIDAIDDIKAKIEIIRICKEKNINIISSMGMANKIDASKVMVSDIKNTDTCRLAKTVRKRLKELGINKLKVVFSKEVKIVTEEKTLGSTSYVPGIAGLLITSEIVKDIIKGS